jgi:hypothetical protein
MGDSSFPPSCVHVFPGLEKRAGRVGTERFCDFDVGVGRNLCGVAMWESNQAKLEDT